MQCTYVAMCPCEYIQDYVSVVLRNCTNSQTGRVINVKQCRVCVSKACVVYTHWYNYRQFGGYGHMKIMKMSCQPFKKLPEAGIFGLLSN